MSRTRNSRPVNAGIVTAIPTIRTIGIQAEEKLKQKSTKKQSRDRERIRTFTNFSKERQNSVLNELSLSTVNITEIKCEKLETEIEKFREAMASLKTESQLLKDKWAGATQPLSENYARNLKGGQRSSRKLSAFKES